MENKEILDFIKANKELFQDSSGRLDWPKIYELASIRFKYDSMGKFTEFWLNRNIHPENYLTELSNYFLCKSTIKEFTIPDNITSIGSTAFSNCSSLASISIGNNVTSIGDSVFLGCTGLTSITIPPKVTSIGEYAFCYCKSLTSIEIPGNVTSISDSAFNNCLGLKNVTIPNSVMSIGDYAFYECGYNLIINYDGTKADWKKIYSPRSFEHTYFTVNCLDGKIVKKKR